MNKAVFLDRDGTINIDKSYLYRVEDFEFLPNALDGMKLLYQAGYLLIVITNQSGIARGYYTEEDFDTLNNYMLAKCREYGVVITDVFYCPHLPEATVGKYKIRCNCRKPDTGLFRRAVDKYDIDLALSYSIGDKMRDLSICDGTGCTGYLICNDISGDVPGYIKTVGSLYEGATDIIQEIM